MTDTISVLSFPLSPLPSQSEHSGKSLVHSFHFQGDNSPLDSLMLSVHLCSGYNS